MALRDSCLSSFHSRCPIEQTNKSKIVLQIYWKFYHGSAKIRNLDFKTRFFVADRDNTLVTTGIHKWSLVLLWKCPIKQTNKFTRFSKVLKRFQQDSEEIKNGDFQTGFFGAERDKTLVMTGIHKWSHAQYFTTRLHLIFNCTLSSVELRQQRHAWPKLECPETFFCFAFAVQSFFSNGRRNKPKFLLSILWLWPPKF